VTSLLQRCVRIARKGNSGAVTLCLNIDERDGMDSRTEGRSEPGRFSLSSLSSMLREVGLGVSQQADETLFICHPLISNHPPIPFSYTRLD